MKHALKLAAILLPVAFAPAWPAAAAEAVFVPLGSAGAAIEIDPARDRIVGEIGELPDVHGLAVTPDGAYLLAASLAETPVGQAPPPPKPEGMSEDEHAAHHAAPAAGAGTAVSFVTVIRLADRTVQRRIEVPGAGHHIAVTPDGRYAVVTHPNTGSASIIDLDGFRVTATVATGPQPSYAVAGPKGDRVYVSNTGNDTISEIDAGRRILRRNLVVGRKPEHMVLSPDGETLYVTEADDGTVAAVALGSGETAASYRIGGELHGLDRSDDGRTLFVSALAENRIAAIDLGSGQVRSAPLGPSPSHLTTMPGAGKLYVSSDKEPTIWVVDEKSLVVLGQIPIRGEGHQMAVVGR